MYVEKNSVFMQWALSQDFLDVVSELTLLLFVFLLKGFQFFVNSVYFL